MDSVLNRTCLPQARGETGEKGTSYPSSISRIRKKTSSPPNLLGVASAGREKRRGKRLDDINEE